MILSRSARAWKAAARIGKAVEGTAKTFGPVIAALWVAWQYHQSQVDKRVEATLGYVARFEDASGSVGKAQRAMTVALWNHADEIAELRTTRATAEQVSRVRQAIASRVVEAAAHAAGSLSGSGPFEELDGFYNALATCMQGGACDRDTALRYFGCTAIDFESSFGQVEDARRRVASRFGWGVRWIAAQAKSSRSCAT